MMVFNMEMFAYALRNYETKENIRSADCRIQLIKMSDFKEKQKQDVLYVGWFCTSDRKTEDPDAVLCRNGSDEILILNASLPQVFNTLLDFFTFYTRWENLLLKAVSSGSDFQACMALFADGFPEFSVKVFNNLGQSLYTNKYRQGTIHPHRLTLIRSIPACHSIALGNSGVHLFWSEYFHTNILFGNLVYPNGAYLIFSIRQYDVPFTSFHIRLAEMAKTILERMDYRFVGEVDNLSLQDCCAALIENRPQSSEILDAMEKFMGWSVSEGLSMAVIKNCPSDEFAGRSLRSVLTDRLHDALFFEYSPYYICLIPSANLRSDLEVLGNTIQAMAFRAGISLPFDHWDQLSDAFFQGRLAVEKSIDPDRVIRFCRDYSWDGILEILAENSGIHLVHPAVMKLAETDRRRGSSLLLTLVVFFRSNCSLQKASDLLHIHVNTLKYRLERVGDIISLDFEDATERIHFLLSYDLLQFGDRLDLPYD